MFNATNSNTQNLKIFSELFSAFPESTSNFEDLEKKDEPGRLIVSEIKDSKKLCYLKARTIMDRQHVKGLETLHKSSLQYFCYVF